MKEVDVAIIGAGTAGLSARSEISKVTQNYVIIDPGPLGTTCARVGCMPSKVLIQAANDFHRRFQLADMGISGAEHLSIDHKKVMQHVRKLRDRFVRGVLKGQEKWQDQHLIKKKARFIDEHTLDCEGEKIHAKKIIIATGSSPIIPKAWQEYQDYLIDTDHFFELETLPKKIALVGLGVIGLELGQALARLGIQVSGFDLKRSIGGISDPEILDYAIESFAQEIDFSFEGAEIKGVEKNGIRIKSGNTEAVFEKVFLSMGRKVNLDSLGIDQLNIEMDERKIPLFDPNTFRIKNTNLYLVGDVNSERPILHEAADEGRIAGYNSVREKDQCFIRRKKLGIVFTDPNIAQIGKSYSELQNESANFIIGSVTYEGQGRAIVKLKEKGLVHIYAHKTTGLLLGAELFAPEAEHLAHLLAWVISLNLNVFDVLSLPFYHPVLEEGLRSALRHLASQVEKEAPDLETLRCQDPPTGRS